MHTAGVLDDRLLDAMDADALETVLRPKLAAARNLHDLTRDRDLTAFVLYSSVSGTLGTIGQANYAAANAYLDALAEQRRAAGLAATSLAWGPWAGGGMATRDAGTENRMRRGGIQPLEPDRAVEALGRATARTDAVLTVADIDWARFAPGFTTSPGPAALLAELPEVRELSDTGPRGAAAGAGQDLRARLAGQTPAERDRTLITLVRTEAAAVLGHASTDRVGAARAFNALGFDSLTAVELRNRIGAATGLALPATLLFDHPDATALAGYLRGLARPDRRRRAARRRPRRTRPPGGGPVRTGGRRRTARPHRRAPPVAARTPRRRHGRRRAGHRDRRRRRLPAVWSPPRRTNSSTSSRTTSASPDGDGHGPAKRVRNA
ncbi:hypothetical protein SALBM217S_07715 [Streptomyces griseoloalbus]